jgi:hypothetical protein
MFRRNKKKKNECYDSNMKCGCGMGCGCGGAVYGLGFIGAAVYYVSTATGFWIGVLGILKALVWPAMIVFEALKALGA